MSSLDDLPRELTALIRGYSAVVPTRNLQFPILYDCESLQICLIKDILTDRHLNTSPPSTQYQRSFWKWVLNHLEEQSKNQDVEIHGDIYDHYLKLLLVGSLDGPPSPSYVTYYLRQSSGLTTRITLLESQSTIESGTTAFRTWLASQVLAAYLLAHQHEVAEQTILELGCGIGFLGILVAGMAKSHSASHHPKSVHLTDVNCEVLRRCQSNVELPCNLSAEIKVNYHKIDWCDSLNGSTVEAFRRLLQEQIRPTLILASDVVFDPDLIRPFVETLRMALASDRPSTYTKPKAIVAITARNAETVALFLQEAKVSLVVTPISFVASIGPSSVDAAEDIRIFEISSQH